MPKFVNVVLNSNNALSGSATNDATYYVDWSAILENKPYKLHFTYIGGRNTIQGLNNKLAQVFVNFGNTFNYANKNNTMPSQGAMTSQFLGFLQPTVFVGASNYDYLQALDSTNVPTYLTNRPMNNTFKVQIYDSQATPALWLDEAATPVVPAPYILVLSFREIDTNE